MIHKNASDAFYRRLSATDSRCKESNEPHIVETINHTLAHDNKRNKHLNRYYCFTLRDAVKLATNLLIEELDITETVVNIHKASHEDILKFEDARERLEQSQEEAVSHVLL